jgi:hypothetical protein
MSGTGGGSYPSFFRGSLSPEQSVTDALINLFGNVGDGTECGGKGILKNRLLRCFAAYTLNSMPWLKVISESRIA